LTRTEKSVQEEGANSHLFWKPDHTTVAVLVDLFFIHHCDLISSL